MTISFKEFRRRPQDVEHALLRGIPVQLTYRNRLYGVILAPWLVPPSAMPSGPDLSAPVGSRRILGPDSDHVFPLGWGVPKPPEEGATRPRPGSRGDRLFGLRRNPGYPYPLLAPERLTQVRSEEPTRDYLIAADVVEAYRNGNEVVRSVLEGADSLWMTALTEMSLMSRRVGATYLRALVQFEALYRIRLVELDDRIVSRAHTLMELYGAWTADSRSMRVTEAFDAAAALRRGLTVLTRNPQRISQVPGMRLAVLDLKSPDRPVQSMAESEFMDDQVAGDVDLGSDEQQGFRIRDRQPADRCGDSGE